MWVQSWVEKIPWHNNGQPAPACFPGKFHGWMSLVGYSPWGCKESNTAEWLITHTWSKEILKTLVNISLFKDITLQNSRIYLYVLLYPSLPLSRRSSYCDFCLCQPQVAFIFSNSFNIFMYACKNILFSFGYLELFMNGIIVHTFLFSLIIVSKTHLCYCVWLQGIHFFDVWYVPIDHKAFILLLMNILFCFSIKKQPAVNILTHPLVRICRNFSRVYNSKNRIVGL